MFLEVIALSAADVIAIQQAGGNRVELVSDMAADGLSPSIQTIERVMEIAEIPIRVMVRFHNNGFVYEKQEVREMCKWIESLEHYPIDGFVFGGLTHRGGVDEYMLASIEQAVKGKGLTFHRAFDRVENQFKVLEQIGKYKVDTILTSGGLQYPIAQNQTHLVELQKQAENITILAGGGVNKAVIELFEGTEINHFHVGGCVRPNGDFTATVSEELVKMILKK